MVKMMERPLPYFLLMHSKLDIIFTVLPDYFLYIILESYSCIPLDNNRAATSNKKPPVLFTKQEVNSIKISFKKEDNLYDGYIISQIAERIHLLPLCPANEHFLLHNYHFLFLLHSLL